MCASSVIPESRSACRDQQSGREQKGNCASCTLGAIWLPYQTYSKREFQGTNAAMSKWTKLYEQLLADPKKVISFRDLEGLLKAFGFEHRRTKGSHRQYVHPAAKAIMTVNPSGKDAHPYQRKRLLELVEQYGLHIDG